MTASLSEQEKVILDTLRSVAKIYDKTTAYREYRRRLVGARTNAEKGLTKEAGKEFAAVQKKFPEFWLLGGVLTSLYNEGFHDGYHEAARNRSDDVCMFGMRRGTKDRFKPAG